MADTYNYTYHVYGSLGLYLDQQCSVALDGRFYQEAGSDTATEFVVSNEMLSISRSVPSTSSLTIDLVIGAFSEKLSPEDISDYAQSLVSGHTVTFTSEDLETIQAWMRTHPIIIEKNSSEQHLYLGLCFTATMTKASGYESVSGTVFQDIESVDMEITVTSQFGPDPRPQPQPDPESDSKYLNKTGLQLYHELSQRQLVEAPNYSSRKTLLPLTIISDALDHNYNIPYDGFVSIRVHETSTNAQHNFISIMVLINNNFAGLAEGYIPMDIAVTTVTANAVPSYRSELLPVKSGDIVTLRKTYGNAICVKFDFIPAV